MIVLALETSSDVCSVALVDGSGLSVERSLTETHIHSEKLLTLVGEVLDRAGKRMQDVAVVAVSIGPGSFTGLRIGLSTAKGLCYALEKQLVIIPTFEAIAETAARTLVSFSRFQVAIDAKQAKWFVGAFEREGGGVRKVGDVEVRSLDEIQDGLSLNDKAVVITDRVEIMNTMFGNRVAVESVKQFCRALTVGRLAMPKVRRNEYSDLASVEPLYLRDFVVRSVAKAVP